MTSDILDLKVGRLVWAPHKPKNTVKAKIAQATKTWQVIYLFSSLAARVFNKLTRYSLKSHVHPDHPSCHSTKWFRMRGHTNDIVIYSKFHWNPFSEWFWSHGGTEILTFAVLMNDPLLWLLAFTYRSITSCEMTTGSGTTRSWLRNRQHTAAAEQVALSQHDRIIEIRQDERISHKTSEKDYLEWNVILERTFTKHNWHLDCVSQWLLLIIT